GPVPSPAKARWVPPSRPPLPDAPRIAKLRQLDVDFDIRTDIDDLSLRLRIAANFAERPGAHTGQAPRLRHELRTAGPLLQRTTALELPQFAAPQTPQGHHANVRAPQSLAIRIGDPALPHLRDVVLQPHHVHALLIDIAESDLAGENL